MLACRVSCLRFSRLQDRLPNLLIGFAVKSSRDMSSTHGVKTVCGTMDFGRLADEAQSNAMVKLCIDSGFYEFDTASIYAGGKSEEIMGNMELLRNQKVIIASKANPNWSEQGLGLQYDGVISQFKSSLERLQRTSIDIFYLHSPDHSTPIEDTLKAVNQLHKEGKFKEFGLSNYAAWEVAEICYICKHNGYVLPTIYQGMYSAITRAVEGELFPCIRKFGLRFYAFSPLAGGILTGKHAFTDRDDKLPVGRFFGTGKWTQVYQDRYWHKPVFDTIDKVKSKLDEIYGKGTVSVLDASLRWMYHHSLLSGQHGDAVILGASKLEHLEKNLQVTKQGPLHQDVVDIFDHGWMQIKGLCPSYNR